MGSGYSKKKKQARMLQDQFDQLQENLRETIVEGVSGNGLVKVLMNGEFELTSISIKPECVDPEDVEGLEDLIKGAFHNAVEKMRENSNNQLSLGGMGGMGDMGNLFSL